MLGCSSLRIWTESKKEEEENREEENREEENREEENRVKEDQEGVWSTERRKVGTKKRPEGLASCAGRPGCRKYPTTSGADLN